MEIKQFPCRRRRAKKERCELFRWTPGSIVLLSAKSMEGPRKRLMPGLLYQCPPEKWELGCLVLRFKPWSSSHSPGAAASFLCAADLCHWLYQIGCNTRMQGSTPLPLGPASHKQAPAPRCTGHHAFLHGPHPTRPESQAFRYWRPGKPYCADKANKKKKPTHSF